MKFAFKHYHLCISISCFLFLSTKFSRICRSEHHLFPILLICALFFPNSMAPGPGFIGREIPAIRMPHLIRVHTMCHLPIRMWMRLFTTSPLEWSISSGLTPFATSPLECVISSGFILQSTLVISNSKGLAETL